VPLASLGFDTAAERYGLDPDEALATGSGPWIPVADPKAQPGPLTGIWLSSYEYESTGRGATFTSHHYVAVVQGAVYHGAIQLLLEPTGRKMTGKWVGFGRDFDLNTGPWTLELITSTVTEETLKEYSRPADSD
jgi:hypothetical protein